MKFPTLNNLDAKQFRQPLNIEKTAAPDPLNPCVFSVTLSADGQSETAGTPLYIVLVVDATSSMGTMDMNNNTATRFQVADEAIQGYLNIIFAPPFADIEKHIALVTFGNGARVHVTQADATGPVFGPLVNPSPSAIGAGGGTVADNYIGANAYNPGQAATALANYNSVTDKTLFFYEDEADVVSMVNNISRYSNTNAQSGLLLARDLLGGAPPGVNKMIIFITDGESAASSTFYAYYNEAGIPDRINSAVLVQQGGQLFANYNGIPAPVTNEDLVREGIDPNNYDPAAFTPIQAVSLKLRALARSTEFFEEATGDLVINPFAGEWHNFDGRNADGVTRVPAVPNLLNDITLNGYYWSNGHIGFAANYYYYQQSPFFAKTGGIWQYSQTPPNPVLLEPVYNDVFWPQSAVGQALETVTFDNSETELMIFATDQKIPQTRLIDYYEATSRNIYASNEAKKFMIRAAEDARADGIIIDSVGIGANVLLPEYLDRVASSGAAFIVPRDIADSQDALRDQLVGFTEMVQLATNNVVIIDAIPRRVSLLPCINDGTFMVDPLSFRTAFVHIPGSPVVFQPVDLNTSTDVELTLENDRSVVTFFAGTLWSAEDAGADPNRFFRAVITFNIVPNPGVHSDNTIGIPDIPANLEANVSWTEAGGTATEDYPPALVYVDASCTQCPPPARCEAITDLISSISMQEAALSRLLDAEGQKLQRAIAMTDITPGQLLAVNRSVTSLVNAVARLEAVLHCKLKIAASDTACMTVI